MNEVLTEPKFTEPKFTEPENELSQNELGQSEPAEGLIFYIIYEECPAKFVLREQWHDPKVYDPSYAKVLDSAVEETLDAVRKNLPVGVVPVRLRPDDDPAIHEVWLGNFIGNFKKGVVSWT